MKPWQWRLNESNEANKQQERLKSIIAHTILYDCMNGKNSSTLARTVNDHRHSTRWYASAYTQSADKIEREEAIGIIKKHIPRLPSARANIVAMFGLAWLGWNEYITMEMLRANRKFEAKKLQAYEGGFWGA